MTIKQVRAIHNYIMIFQNHWCFYIVIYMILLVAGQNYKILPAHWLIWLGIGFLPYVFSKLKKLKVLRYLIYLLLALGIYSIPFPHIAYTIIYLVGVAYYVVTTEMYDWTKDDSSDYKPIPLVVIMIMTVVVAFIFQYIRLFEYQKNVIYIMIWNVVLYSVASYVNKYMKFLELNKHSVGYMPIKTVLGSGVISMLGFSSLLSVLLLVVANIGRMDDVLQYIRKFLGFFGRKIRDFIKRFDFEQNGGPDLGGAVEPMIPEQISDKNSVWDIILSILVLIILLWIAYKLIRMLFEFLSGLFAFDGSGTAVKKEEDIYEKTDVVEKLDAPKRDGIFAAMNPALRIRRRFRKKVLSEEKKIAEAGKKDRMELYTARECSGILENTEMGNLYEKARYSPYECTPEDVKRMKNLCKGKE
ncbi:MAG: hypothetical protein IKL22_10110 [Lachnospiraceae bacterium]|nr:hypothetical protein [Lachnospiraceae bacterium]